MFRSIFPACLVAAFAAAAPAADPVEQELAALVDDVAALLDKQNQTTIRMGKFTGDGDIPSHFGPELQRVLAAGFAKKKITVNKDALIEIKGDYSPATEDPAAPDARLMFLRLNATLMNTKNRLVLANLNSRAVYGNDTLARAFAPTGSLPPDADLKTRNDELKKHIEKPHTHTANSLVRSSANSPFAVEILVVDDAKSADPKAGAPVTVKDGLAFVEVNKKQSYRVKVHNTAKFDVAVRLSIDGLDQFVFADKEFRDDKGNPKFQYMIVPAGKAAVIKGWFVNLKQADSFLVTEYAKSAVAELNASQGEVGQICVQFHAAWEKDADKPADETGKDAATGRGEKVGVDLKPVKRQIGALRDQVAIRYTK